MTSLNVSLPESMREFVEREVSGGSYGTVSEYVRDLIRREQKRKAQERLEALLMEGINSGPATPFTAAEWAEMHERLQQRLAERNKQ